MCFRCDNPSSSREDYLSRVAELKRCHGWAVQGVEGDRFHPPWAYTVGLTDCGLPELVVTGMPIRKAARLLNIAAGHALHAPPLRHGEHVELPDGIKAEIVRLPQPDAHLPVALALCGPQVRAHQLVWADGRGRWPWEVGFRGTRGGQPVLGPRAAA